MESSSLRLAISWAHPQGNTDSLWGRLKVCETMKKKDTNIQTNTIKQTQNTQHTKKDKHTKHTWAPPLPPQGDTHSLWRKLEVCQCTMTNQRHIFKILFLLLSHPNEKNEIHRFSARRSGREQLSRLEDFVSVGGTLASSLFSGSLTMRSINLNLQNRDITKNKILRASLTFKGSPICFVFMGIFSCVLWGKIHQWMEMGGSKHSVAHLSWYHLVYTFKI